MTLEREVKATLTPFELDPGDTLRLRLSSGRLWEMTLRGAAAAVVARGFDRYRDAGHAGGDISVYAFEATAAINGRDFHMRREVGSQASFHDPWVVDGVRVWLDGASCVFKDKGGFMEEKDWRGGLLCSPFRLTRWAVQEEGRGICPGPLGDWYPNPTGRLDIRDCYTGEDCWMGPYNGGAAHGGLDINMPACTILTAPFDLDDHFLYNSVAAGFDNNRWLATRRWPDGSTWEIRACHLVEMLVPERTPLKRGTPYATTAGTHVGLREHTHFVWRVLEQGGAYFLDPWILMREIWARRDGRCRLSR